MPLYLLSPGLANARHVFRYEDRLGNWNYSILPPCSESGGSTKAVLRVSSKTCDDKGCAFGAIKLFTGRKVI